MFSAVKTKYKFRKFREISGGTPPDIFFGNCKIVSKLCQNLHFFADKFPWKPIDFTTKIGGCKKCAKIANFGKNCHKNFHKI